MTDETPEAALDETPEESLDETPEDSLGEPLDETSIGPHTERSIIGQPRKDALCGARKLRAGPPCRRSPIRGGTKCALHGGSSPLARQAAERRLLYGVSLAIDRLIDALSEHDHEGPCALCGCSPLARDPVAIRAAIALLDRSGFAPSVRLQHSTEEDASIREVRVNIISPSPEQMCGSMKIPIAKLQPYVGRNARLNANSAVEAQEPALERKDTSLVFDLER